MPRAPDNRARRYAKRRGAGLRRPLFSLLESALLLGAALAVGVALAGRARVGTARVDTVGLLRTAAGLVLRVGGIAVAVAVPTAGDSPAGTSSHQRHGEQRSDAT